MPLGLVARGPGNGAWVWVAAHAWLVGCGGPTASPTAAHEPAEASSSVVLVPAPRAASVPQQAAAIEPTNGDTAPPDRRRAGLIGLFLERGDDGEPGVPVQGVMPGYPAEKAGIGPGDVLTSVAGTRVGTFREVVQLLSKRHAGERVEVEVLDAASGQPRTLLLELAEETERERLGEPASGYGDPEPYEP